MEAKNDHHIKLVKRYFQGKIDDNEAKELNKWINASPEHLAQFDQFKKEWRSTEDNLFINESWKKVISRVQRLEQLDIQLKPKNKVHIWQVAAAASILILFSVSILWLLQSYEPKDQIASIIFETPRGQRSKITLPDSTVVWLNAETKLKVLAMNSERRKVLLNGQAHFEVNRNEKAPFTVETADYDITVLGTVFDVMAYADMNRTVTTLYEGLVRVDSEMNSFELKPGEQAVYKAGKFELVETKNDLSIKGWVDNNFHFDQVPMAELLLRLGRWYDVEFIYNEVDLKGLVFGGAFKNEETIWQVLDVIKLYVPIDYSKSDIRKIEITRKK